MRKLWKNDQLLDVQALAIDTEGARNAIDVLTRALWILAAVAAVAGFAAIGIVLTRGITNTQLDQSTLLALGFTRRDRIAANLPRAVLVAGAARWSRESLPCVRRRCSRSVSRAELIRTLVSRGLDRARPRGAARRGARVVGRVSRGTRRATRSSFNEQVPNQRGAHLFDRRHRDRIRTGADDLQRSAYGVRIGEGRAGGAGTLGLRRCRRRCRGPHRCHRVRHEPQPSRRDTEALRLVVGCQGRDPHRTSPVSITTCTASRRTPASRPSRRLQLQHPGRQAPRHRVGIPARSAA